MKAYLLDLNGVEKVEWEKYASYVSTDRQERIQKLHNPRQILVSLGAGLLISLAYGEREKKDFGVEKLSFEQLLEQETLQRMEMVEVLKATHGKPYWPHCDRHFNLSHSGDYILLVSADGMVGCDIQKVVPRQWGEIAKRFYGDKEWEQLKGADENAFFKLWCEKEAYGKFTGEGLQGILEKNLSDLVRQEEVLLQSTFFMAEKDKYYVAICKERESTDEEDFVLFKGV